MRRRTVVMGVVTMTLIGGAVLTGAVNAPQDSSPKVTAAEGPKLKLCVWRENTGRSTSRLSDGVLFAVWDDGKVLYAPRWDHSQDDMSYVTAELKEPVEDYLKRCTENEAIFSAEQRFYLVPSGGRSVKIAIDRGEKHDFVAAGWDEILTPNYGISVGAADARAFVKSWYSFRFTLSTTPMQKNAALTRKDGDEFRGIPLWSGTMANWRLRNIKK